MKNSGESELEARRRRRRLRRRIRWLLRLPFVWLGIGLALAILPQLPRRALFAFCDLISLFFYCFDFRGRRYAADNLAAVMSSARHALSPRAARLIIRRSYRNMARSVGYAFWTIRSARSRCAEAGELSETAARFLSENRPAVTVSGHIGCWEILSQLAFLAGHRMMSVAKDVGTSGMTRLLMRARRSIGQEIVPAEGAFNPLMAGIRSGTSLGLLVDQKVITKHGGVWVRFLGRPLPVSAAPAFFSAKAKAPIVVAWSRPLKDGRYRAELVDVIAPEEARDIWKTTQRCSRDLERIIRRHPSCWVLNYNLFSTVPTESDLAALAKRETGG